MARKIEVIGKPAERIEDTGRALPRIEPGEFAAGLGAESYSERVADNLDPLAMAAIGNELIKRLRSTGGRPALADASQVCKVPLSPADVAALEEIVTAIERKTGTRPALGQIASVILRTHLDMLKNGPR